MAVKLGRLFLIAIFSLLVIVFFYTSKIVFADNEIPAGTSGGGSWTNEESVAVEGDESDTEETTSDLEVEAMGSEVVPLAIAANNTFLGQNAGRDLDTTGLAKYNTLIGFNSGMRVKKTDRNTFVGALSGRVNNGSGNVFLGYRAGYNEKGSNKLYIANSDGIPLIGGDFATGNVGIGDTTPEFKLSLDGDGGIIAKGTFDSGATLSTSGTGTRMMWYPKKVAFRAGFVDGGQWDDANIGDYSIAMGHSTTASGWASIAMGSSTTASSTDSTAMGVSTTASGFASTAMGWNTTASGDWSTTMGGGTTASGTHSTAIGRGTSASGNISTAIGERTTAKSFIETVIGSYNTDYTPNDTQAWDSSDRLFVIGNGNGIPSDPDERSNALTVLKNGDVGIGTDTPNYKLDVRGSIGSDTTLYHSDIRWKKNVSKLKGALDKVTDLRGVNFEWRVDEFPEMAFSKGTNIGFIAQEVEEALPELVSSGKNGFKSVQYANIVPILVEAVKELKAENDKLKETLTAMADRQKSIEDMLLALSATPAKEKLVKLENINIDKALKAIQ